MAEYHQIVDRIRGYLESNGLGEAGSLSALATDYANACEQANKRLLACSRWLHQGLRAEAVHLADTEPNLLNLVAVLDFAERPDWDALTDEKGLPRAQQLNVDAAQALDQAYALHNPLRDSLRRHRLLALAEAPLSQRLAHLRTIAESDPENPIWREDIKRYEAARLDQVPREVMAAVAREDVRSLERLVAELKGPAWIGPPPPSVIKNVQNEIARLRRNDARKRLAAIAIDLGRAYDDIDLVAARGFRDAWEEFSPQADLAADDPLLVTAEPVLRWVEEEDRREGAERALRAAIDSLEEALDRGETDLAELDYLAEEIRDRGEMPAELEKRSDLWCAQVRQRSRRRAIQVAVATVVGSIVVASASYLMYDASRARKRVAAHAQNLAALLDEDDVVAAQAYREKLPDSVARAAELAQPLERLQLGLEKENARKEALHDLLIQLGRTIADRKNPPILEKINAFPVRKDEEKEVDAARSKYAERYMEEKHNAERDFDLRSRKVENEIKSLEDLAEKEIGSGTVAAQMTKVDEKLGELGRFRKDHEGLLAELAQKRIEDLDGRRLAVAKKVVDWNRQNELTNQITESILAAQKDPAAYTRALQEYVRAFPGTPRGLEFQKVLDQKSAWSGEIALSRALRTWMDPGRKLLDVTEAKLAAARAGECSDLLKSSPSLAEAATVRRYQSFLEAVAERGTGARGKLEAKWQDDFAARLKVVLFDEGGMLRRYYYLNEPKVLKTAFGFQVYFDFQKPRELQLPKNNVKFMGPAPQCAIAAKLNDRLKKNLPWEETILQTLGDLLETPRADPNKPQFDSVFRYDLLKTTANLGAEGSLFLREALRPLLDDIDRAGIDVNVRWMDPRLELAADERMKAERADGLFKDPPDLEKVARELVTKRNQLERDLTHLKTPTGWLERQGSTPRCRAIQVLPKNADLWALDAAPRPAVWKRIGEIRDRRCIVTSAPAVPEGSLIFSEDTGDPNPGPNPRPIANPAR